MCHLHQSKLHTYLQYKDICNTTHIAQQSSAFYNQYYSKNREDNRLGVYVDRTITDIQLIMHACKSILWQGILEYHYNVRLSKGGTAGYKSTNMHNNKP